ncbi:DMT family transporter [Thermococcus sp.]|uniref:DMT family transporter n=1 Tax=Thermococcus sp. TaxID=35749 RepID=UPI0034591C88
MVTRGNLTNLNFSDLVGVALGLGSAVVWATYWLLNLRDKRSLIEKTFWNFLFGFAYVSVLLAFAGGFSIPPVEGLIGAVYVGLFEMGVTFLIWYKAVEDDVAFASNLAYFIPFLSLVFIFLVVGEDIMPGTLTGLVLIVLGILIGRKV